MSPVRILHTSDWHLGQHFMGKTRQDEHQALIDWLIEQVQVQQVDAVLIAGDIFDTGSPPSYARELYNHLVLGLRSIGVSLWVLGGNHDSVATLSESRQLLSCLGTTVIPAVAERIEQQVLVLRQRDGTAAAILCAIPYIRPRDVQQSRAGQSAEEKQLGLQEAIAQHYEQVYQRACQERERLGLSLPIVATGHLTTVGASASESVREIYVGALQAFPSAAFPAADYIALGHIHKPQKVGGQAHIRYSGSPIPLSFDEANRQQEVLLVDLDDSGLVAVSPLAVPCFQALVSVQGDLPSLALQIREAAQRGGGERPVWLDVQVQSDDYLSDLQARIEAMTAGLPVEVLRLRRQRADRAATLPATLKVTLDELSPLEVFNKRLEQEALEDDLCAPLRIRYLDILAQLQASKP